MAAASAAQPAQIWRDDCYYLNRDTGECERKYVLVLAVDGRSDGLVTAVFTTKSHGLSEHPACSLGPPRGGYFVGIPGGVLTQPTWVEFNSIQDVDRQDWERLQRGGRVHLLPLALPMAVFCGVLRCLSGFDDLTGRQAKLIGDLAAAIKCP